MSSVSPKADAPAFAVIGGGVAGGGSLADRLDFFFRQRVTEAELDLAFSLLEKADRNLAADLNIQGVIAGAVPTPHAPVPDLTVDLTAPARAYDTTGQRIFFGTGQTVDCAVDLVGIPTEVTTAGSERWIGIFLRFSRQLSDPRTDGNSQQVFFRRDESFELVVRQAPEGAAGTAPRPTLQADELLLCDVRRRRGQTQILAADIDTSRRQAFIFVQGSSVGISAGTWSILAPLAANVQAALDDVDTELRDHFTAAARRHAASAVDFIPRGFLAAQTVQAAIDELVDDLTTATLGSSGAVRIGVDAAVGTPHALAAGTVKSQLAALLGLVNAHVGAVAGAHAASAVDYTPRGFVAARTVQAALDELIDDLTTATSGNSGALRVGSDASAGSPHALTAGSVKSQLAALLGLLNAHVGATAGAHTANAIGAAAHNHIAATNVQAQLQEIVADLLATSSAAPGVGLVGVDAIAGAPLAITAGSLRAALTTLLAGHNAHASQSTGAHTAAAISVVDEANQLLASNVEAALAEVLSAFRSDHFLGTAPYPGAHGTIHQPNLGGTKALLWDSQGTGGVAARLRVYADEDSIPFTLNAPWNGAAWARENLDYYAGGFRFSRLEFEFLQETTAATFLTWSRTWRLPMSSAFNSGFELTGSIQETGRLAVTFTNCDSLARRVSSGGAVTFRNRFPAPPSSITLTPEDVAENFAEPIFPHRLNRDGFTFFTNQSLAASLTTFWHGRYSVLV